MIESFAHKGLKALFENDDARGIRRDHVARVKDILLRLDSAERIEHLETPGSGLHSLRGDLKGHHAVKVNKNWRITFRFVGSDVHDVNLIDFH